MRALLDAGTRRALSFAQLSALGWFFAVFVAWASVRSIISGDVFGLVLALALLLAGFRWFGPLLTRSGGAE